MLRVLAHHAVDRDTLLLQRLDPSVEPLTFRFAVAVAENRSLGHHIERRRMLRHRIPRTLERLEHQLQARAVEELERVQHVPEVRLRLPERRDGGGERRRRHDADVDAFRLFRR